jgi:ubiquinone/menaquinone biosynthesis C-methylase UbiE
VADKVTEETKTLEVGAGHARISERIKSKYPNSFVLASDQCEEAMKISRHRPYEIFSAYEIPYPDKYFDLIIAAQCLEYMSYLDTFFIEAKRVAKKFICTIPKGEMKSWSQLYIFDEKKILELLEQYGDIEILEVYESLILVKIKFR